MSEEIKKVEKALEDIGAKIDVKIKEAEEVAKNTTREVGEKMLKEHKDELNVMLEEFNKKSAELDKRVDEFETNAKRLKGYEEAKKPKHYQMYEKIKDSAEFQNFKNNKKANIEFKNASVTDFFTKADLDQSSNFVNDVVDPDYIAGINFDPDEPNRIRAFIPVSGTASNEVRYLQETARTDNAGTKAEAAALDQSEFTITQQTASVQKIGHYVTVTNEMLEDLPALMGYMSNRLARQVKVVEDQQLLYGTGAAPQIEGITVNAAAYVDSIADSNVQEWDVLAASIKQLRESNYVPNAIMVDPGKYNALITAKDSDGKYLNDWIFSQRPLNIMGVPIIQNNSVTDGDFIVGDFNIAAQVFDKRQLSLEMSESHSTDFIEDKVTIRLTERLTLANYRPGAVIYGTFAEALAQGSA